MNVYVWVCFDLLVLDGVKALKCCVAPSSSSHAIHTFPRLGHHRFPSRYQVITVICHYNGCLLPLSTYQGRDNKDNTLNHLALGTQAWLRCPLVFWLMYWSLCWAREEGMNISGQGHLLQHVPRIWLTYH